MECFYLPELQSASGQISLYDEEFRHLQVLRIREGESLLLSNGKGLCCHARLLRSSGKSAELNVVSQVQNDGEPGNYVRLAIGLLDNKDRMEWLVEKGTELGLREITFVHTRYSSKRPIAHSRLTAKAIAALKQCRRSYLPLINEATSLSQLLQSCTQDHLILADPLGELPIRTSGSVCAFVGPEGGFHEDERTLLLADPRSRSWKLSNSRLRAETAALSITSQLCVS